MVGGKESTRHTIFYKKIAATAVLAELEVLFRDRKAPGTAEVRAPVFLSYWWTRLMARWKPTWLSPV